MSTHVFTLANQLTILRMALAPLEPVLGTPGVLSA